DRRRTAGRRHSTGRLKTSHNASRTPGATTRIDAVASFFVLGQAYVSLLAARRRHPASNIELAPELPPGRGFALRRRGCKEESTHACLGIQNRSSDRDYVRTPHTGGRA